MSELSVSYLNFDFGRTMLLCNITLRIAKRGFTGNNSLRSKGVCCTPRKHFRRFRSNVMGSHMSLARSYNIENNILAAGILPRHFSTTQDNGKSVSNLKLKGKPPNILIYTSEIIYDTLNSSILKFTEIKEMLKQIVDCESYTLYHGKSTTLQTDVWIENTELLVVFDQLSEGLNENAVKFVHHGGKVLSCCAKFNASVLDSVANMPSIQNNFRSFIKCITVDSSGTVLNSDSKYDLMEGSVKHLNSADTVILCCFKNGDGMFISTYNFSDMSAASAKKVMLENAFQQTFVKILSFILIDVLSLKSCKINSKSSVSKSIFLLGEDSELEALLTKELVIQSISAAENKSKVMEAVGRQDVNIISDGNDPDVIGFSSEQFYDLLRTKYLGKLILYADVLPSTMKLLSVFQKWHGLTVIASKQTQGQGRGGNEWLSPEGCAMFSVSISVSRNSLLGSHVSILQLIVSLSVVDAILDISGYENLPLRLKWPNDIYCNDNTKIGGVLTSSSMVHDVIFCNVGIGVNLSNASPTVCINQIINLYNGHEKTNLSTFTNEEFIARVLNKLEDLIDQFENVGHFSILNRYYNRWLHDEAYVTISSSVQGFCKEQFAKVVGVDKYGFIQVKTDDGKVHSVQPDGNSFDLMKNLILAKT